MIEKLKLYFLAALLIVLFTNGGLSHSPELQRVHSFPIDEIKYGELRKITNWERHGNLVAVNEDRALLQVGKCDIMVIELDSGRIEKRINMHELLQWVTESLHEHWGAEYCVPGRESFSGRVKPEFYAIRFDRIVKYPGKNQYATFTHSVVLNQEKDNERDIFVGVLVFNEDLEILDFHALKGHEELQRSSSIMKVGFFHKNLLFAKFWGARYNHDFDFMKFEKSPEGFYQMIDTMDHWPALVWEKGRYGIFSNTLEREDGFHLFMGKEVLVLQDWPDSGNLRKLPLDSVQYIRSIEAIGPEGWSAAWVVNRIYTRHGEPSSLEGHLSLIDPDYRRIRHQEYYNFWEQRLLSMSVLDNKVYLLFFDKRKKFIVEVFDLVEGE